MLILNVIYNLAGTLNSVFSNLDQQNLYQVRQLKQENKFLMRYTEFRKVEKIPHRAVVKKQTQRNVAFSGQRILKNGQLLVLGTISF